MGQGKNPEDIFALHRFMIANMLAGLIKKGDLTIIKGYIQRAKSILCDAYMKLPPIRELEEIAPGLHAASTSENY